MGSALQTRLFMPHWVPVGAPTLASATIDASNDGVSFVFEALNTEPITHVGIRITAVTGTVTNLAAAALEGVSATTGLPDGSDLGGGSPTSALFTPTGSGAWQWIPLTNSYTPTRGQLIAMTIRGQAGLDGSNFFTVTRNDANTNTTPAHRPYPVTLVGGTWTISATFPFWAVRTANSRYGTPYESTLTTRSSTTVGNRNAMYFTVPADWGWSTYKVAGIRGMVSPAAAAAKAPLLGMWNAAGTVQGTTKALDSDQGSDLTVSNRDASFFFDDATLATLSAGTEYYVGFESADAANGGSIIRSIELSEDNDKLCYPGGTNIGLATWDGVSWTKDTTTFARPWMELILEDITPASGAGPFSRIQTGM